MATGPRIGQPVHYLSHGSADGTYPATCRAATVTEVDGEQWVGLAVLNPTGLFFRSLAEGGVSQDEHQTRGGTWHWPCTPTPNEESPR